MARSGRGCVQAILGLILVPLLLGGLGWFLSDLTRVLSHETVEGVVVELIPSVDSDGDTVYAPVYEYEVDGRVYHYRSKVDLGGMLVPGIGDTKTLLYNPDDPADARVKNLFLLLVLPGLLVGISALAFFALLVTWARGAWTRQHEPDWLSKGTVREELPWAPPEVGDRRVAITATFMGTEASPMDDQGRVRYRVRARAEIDGQIHRFESDWLDADPTLDLMQRGNQLEVRIDPGNPADYEVVVPR